MTDLIAVQRIAGWEKLKTLVLDSVSSPITKRVYNMALDEFLGWFQQAPRPGFTKATVSAWRVSLEDRGLGSSSIIIRMSAIRKLAAEAADNGLLAPELAAGISRVKSAKTQGIRTGNWLSQRQAQALLSAPDISTLRGLRDRAILAVLLGCGLRRSEVAALTFSHLQQRDGRWCIVDLVGKHGRVRTAPMPTWVKVAVDAWTAPAGVADGCVFRSVNRAGRVEATKDGDTRMTIEAKSVPSISVSYACNCGSTKANALGMRPMQERAYEKRGEQYLLIKSPPASGKSRALMFIALDKLRNQGLKQAIIVVPESAIATDRRSVPRWQ